MVSVNATTRVSSFGFSAHGEFLGVHGRVTQGQFALMSLQPV